MTTESTLAVSKLEQMYTELAEGYASLEAEMQLLQDDRGWSIVTNTQDEFTKAGINQIADLSRLFYLKNPLINRGVEVKKYYVFGSPPAISAKWQELNTVVQAFLDDYKNKQELTSHMALQQKEIERQTDGNIFFVLFTNQQTGAVKLRTIELSEITRIITNPEDKKDVWYYLREWQYQNASGAKVSAKALYPDWKYTNFASNVDGIQVMTDAPIYHAKSGAFSSWQYGLSEVYAALDWAKAYKSFLEDWATITRSLATFAWKATTKGGARAVSAMQSTLNTTLSSTHRETNPPPARGSIAVMNDDRTFEPMKTAGATTSMEDGRRLLLMVCAALGLPETFFGDTSVGSLATARSLDRPTELMMQSIQSWWTTVIGDILSYVVYWAVSAPSGMLRGYGEATDGIVQWANDPETQEPYNVTIDINFVPIVDSDPLAAVQAIMAAAPALPDTKLVAKQLLNVLGIPNIDEVLAAMFDDQAVLDQQTVEAARALRAELKQFIEASHVA